MKIRNQQIATLVARLKKPRGVLRSPQIMHPMREWLGGLVVGIILLAVAVVWGATTYLSYRNVTVIDNTDNQISETAYRSAQVTQAITEFTARAAEHASLLGVAPTEAVVVPEENTEPEESATSTASVGDVDIASTTEAIVTEEVYVASTTTASSSVEVF